MQEWNEQKLPEVLPGCSEGRLPGRSTQINGREVEEEVEGSEERKIRQEIAQEVVAGIKEMASAHDDAKATAQRTVGEEETEKEEEEEKEKGGDGGGGGDGEGGGGGGEGERWRSFWNEEGWKEVLCMWKSRRRYQN